MMQRTRVRFNRLSDPRFARNAAAIAAIDGTKTISNLSKAAVNEKSWHTRPGS
jgi:hypothetical protein